MVALILRVLTAVAGALLAGVKTVRLVGLVLALLLVAGCGSPGPTPVLTAADACDAAARVHAGTVAAAFTIDVAKARSLLLHAPPRWADLPPSYPAAYCFIDTEINKGPPPGPLGTMSPPFDRSVVIVVDGESMVLEYGRREVLPVEAP